jgi:hypothetical protein
LVEDLLCAIPNIAIIQDRRQEEIEEHNDCEGIASDVERSSQWCTSIVDLSPVKADGKQAKAGVHLVVIMVSYYHLRLCRVSMYLPRKWRSLSGCEVQAK